MDQRHQKVITQIIKFNKYFKNLLHSLNYNHYANLFHFLFCIEHEYMNNNNEHE